VLWLVASAGADLAVEERVVPGGFGNGTTGGAPRVVGDKPQKEE
jgi:hypothetical protein